MVAENLNITTHLRITTAGTNPSDFIYAFLKFSWIFAWRYPQLILEQAQWRVYCVASVCVFTVLAKPSDRRRSRQPTPTISLYMNNSLL